MSLIRLRRQDIHTCICCIVLILINGSIFYLVNGSIPVSVLFVIVYIVVGLIFGGFAPGIRKKADLWKRLMLSVCIALAAAVLITRDFFQMVLLLLLFCIAHGIWLVLAKKWMQHEISPGWTLLLYDSRENMERAKAIVESRKDLMVDTCHCVYGRTEEWDGQYGKAYAVSHESELDHLIRLFRIPQMVICLETGSEEIIEYCKKAGITAFVKESDIQRGQKIDKDGLLYIRPVPTVLGRIFGNDKNGVACG